MIALRFILSFVQFLWLAHLPVLMSPLLASCFVLCLRMGLLATPLWVKATGRYALIAATIGIGVLPIFTLFPESIWFGALGISLLLSTAAFLIRQCTSKAVSLASFNKMALHGGSLAAGMVAIFSLDFVLYFYYVLAGIAIIPILLSLYFPIEANNIQNDSQSWQGETRHLGLFWFTTGIVMGFRSYSPYVVLPAMLTQQFGQLPSTYGGWMMVYSLLVILWQLPSSKGFRCSISACLKFLALGCFTICGLLLPGVMSSTILIWLWIILISSQELFAASLDVEANKENGLFLKEIGVGIGGGLGVLLVQLNGGPAFITLIGLFCLTMGYWCKASSLQIRKAKCPTK